MLASVSLSSDTKAFLIRTKAVKNVLLLALHNDVQVRRDAVFCVANLSDSPELQVDIISEGSIDILHKVGNCHDMVTLRDISRAFSSLSTTNAGKESIIKNGVLGLILTLARSIDILTQRHAALSICNVSCSGNKAAIVDSTYLRTLIFLLRFPDLNIERYILLTVAALCLGGSDNCKLKMIKEGFMQHLLEKVKFPDIEINCCAALAINSVVMGEYQKIKEEVATCAGLPSILSLAESNDKECAYIAVYLLGNLAENDEVKAKLVGLNTISIIVRTSYSASIQLKRASAYFLALLASGVDYHNNLAYNSGLEAVIHLAMQADLECQEFSAFSLAYIASNREYQVKLVQMGAIRPLVAMMAADDESKHYAGLALLKLADNYENHLTIAEEGGIQALLKMGRNQVTDEELQYKAALTVGNLASNAVNLMPTEIKTKDGIGFATSSLQRRKIKNKKVPKIISDSLDKLNEEK